MGFNSGFKGLIQSTSSHPISLSSLLNITAPTVSRSSRWSLLSRLPYKNLVCTSLLSHACVTSPALLIPLEFNLLIMCGKQNQCWSSAVRNFVQLLDTTIFLGIKTLLTVLSRMSLLGNVYHVLLSMCHFLKEPGSMQSLLECFMYNSLLFMRSCNWSEKSVVVMWCLVM